VRLLRIRKAKELEKQLRDSFEKYGMECMRIILATTNHGSTTTFKHQGNEVRASNYVDSILSWLTEEYDKKDRKDNWLLVMEIAITIFVFVEMIISICNISYVQHFFKALLQRI